MTETCTVCGAAHAAEMVDGKTRVHLCDACRPLTVLLWHVHNDLQVAAREARQALGTREYVKK